MQTLATCREIQATEREMRPHGFTLLEMIVVLAILGLATAMVVPSMLRGIDSWRRNAEMDSLLDQIRALPGNARASGNAIAINEQSLKSDHAPLHISADWKLVVPRPWKVNGNGVCEGGDVDVSNAYGTRTIRVTAPFCDPTVQP